MTSHIALAHPTESSRRSHSARGRTSLALRFLVCCALLAFALAPRATAENLRIAGSDSMVPLLEALASALAPHAPELRVNIGGRGSTTGPPALLRGSADLAAMTRPMNEIELAAFQAKFDRPPRRFAIANDAVAVFVSARSPIDELTLEQVDAIFSRDRRCGGLKPIITWGDLGISGDWSTRRIGVYVTPPSSGTRGFFEMVALCQGKVRRDAREQPGTGSIVHALQQSEYGISYGSRAVLVPGIKQVRLVPDPLARQLFLYERSPTEEAPSAATRRFLAFALSDAGQEIVLAHGLGRIGDALRAEQVATLE